MKSLKPENQKSSIMNREQTGSSNLNYILNENTIIVLQCLAFNENQRSLVYGC